MARTHLSEMLLVADPLQTWNWDIIIPNVPGGAAPRAITYKAISTEVPASSMEQVPLNAHGVKLNFAGRRTWSGTWTVEMFETRTEGTRDALFRWLEFARSWEQNSGNYKENYAVTAELILYDDIPQEVRRIKVFGAFPTEVGTAQLNQESDIIRYSVTFSFDYTDS